MKAREGSAPHTRDSTRWRYTDPKTIKGEGGGGGRGIADQKSVPTA